MKYAIKLPIDIDASDWLYLTNPDEDGNPVVVTFDTKEMAESVNFGVWSNYGRVVEYKEPKAKTGNIFIDASNLVDDLSNEEIEELRAKKQAIKEELYDKVKMEMFKASSKLEGIDYELPYSTRKEAADEKIGKWLSAALEDPTTCGAMKDDINEWFMAIEVERRLRTKKKQMHDELHDAVKTKMFKGSSKLDHIEYEGIEVQCKTHPDAPHGFDRNASHSLGRYVCECEYWEPDWEPEDMLEKAIHDDSGEWKITPALLDTEVEGWDITKPAELKQLLQSMCDRIDGIEHGDDYLS